MSVTTPVNELLAIARRYEVECRWAQAAAAYDEALANMAHPTSKDVSGDRALIEGMRMACVHRSHEMESITITSVTEAARWALDRQGERAAAKFVAATGRIPQQ